MPNAAPNTGEGTHVLCRQATGQYNTSAWSERCFQHIHRKQWKRGFELAEKSERGQSSNITDVAVRWAAGETPEAGHAGADQGTLEDTLRG